MATDGYGSARAKSEPEAALPSDDLNAPMRARIYELADREARLRLRITDVERSNRKHARWLIASLVLHAVSLAVIGYLVFTRL